MTEEATPVEGTEEPAVVVDLDSNPPDGTVGKSHEGFKAPVAEEPEPEEPAAEGDEPAVEEPEEEGEKDADGELDKSVWGDTQTEVGNSVLGMLQDSGISVEDAKALMYDAVVNGDVTKIDVAALTEKVGKHAAAIILNGTKNFITENKVRNEGIVKDVHDTVGGEANWNAASKWASANMPESTLAEYRPMIDKGGAAARFAAGEILAAYNADAANTTLAPTTPRAEPTATSAPTSKATTRAEYFSALEKANRRGATNKELATIQADRNRGRARGI
jgi:hypothetical protein